MAFYILAYVYSWLIAVPLALQAQGVIPAKLPYWLHYLTAFGPALAALTLTRQMPKVRGRLGWSALGALSPLALFAAVQAGAWLAGIPFPTWNALGRINFISRDLGLWAWGLWLVTNGFGEELGWRGYALPRLQRSRSALTSSVMLGFVWACWHLPAFFYVPSYGAMSLALIPGFVMGVVAGSIVLAWLFNASGGEILPVMLWHASFNFVTASPASAGLPAAFVSVAVIAAAVLIVLTALLHGNEPGSAATAGRVSGSPTMTSISR